MVSKFGPFDNNSNFLLPCIQAAFRKDTEIVGIIRLCHPAR
jgi:hypothetical protein